MNNHRPRSLVDQKLLEELRDFFPARVFDGHAHLWRREDCVFPPGCEFARNTEGTAASWRASQERIFGPDRLVGGFFLGEPRSSPARMNDFLLQELRNEPCSRGAVLITPDQSPDQAAGYFESRLIAGFKPYHAFSAEKPTFESSIKGFVPEWVWRLAHERRLVIVLHLVKKSALNDPKNQREIREHCEKYPGARVILAHAGRGFHAPNTVNGISGLRGLENVWFDSAAICEPEPLLAVLEEFGPRKLLWGSDFWISDVRGKPVTLGDGFAWLTDQTVDWDLVSRPYLPTLVEIESLRALQAAVRIFGSNAEDVEDVFYGNAAELLNIERRGEGVTRKTYDKAKSIIPGGTQLLSKRPEMYAPGQWPAYFREARGCEIWDLDGRRYYDFSTNGVGSCLLGYRDRDVTDAVKRRIALGSMSSLNPPEEEALAEDLLEIHPWADRVRFARTGGESMAVAVRIARATTDRSGLAVCGYSGWQDWYLAANLGAGDSLRGHLLPGLRPLGVPGELRGTVSTFHYGRIDELRRAVDVHGRNLAAVVMEPCRYRDPEPGFLEEVARLSRAAGALVVFDEITIGWRLVLGGAHLKFGVSPDIAVFAKALGNGHPMAAVLGTKTAMEGAHSSFISSTYWTESVGPAAALATIRKMRRIDVRAHVADIGRLVTESWRACGERHGLPLTVEEGYPCLAHFHFDGPQANDARTYYTQLMLDRGFLAGVQFYPTLAHTEDVVAKFGTAVDSAFADIAVALRREDLKDRLRGQAAHTGFARLL